MFVAQAMLVRQAPEQAFEVVLPLKWAHVTLGPEANPAYVAFLLANDDTKYRNVAPDTCEPEHPAGVNPVEQGESNTESALAIASGAPCDAKNSENNLTPRSSATLKPSGLWNTAMAEIPSIAGYLALCKASASTDSTPTDKNSSCSLVVTSEIDGANPTNSAIKMNQTRTVATAFLWLPHNLTTKPVIELLILYWDGLRIRNP